MKKIVLILIIALTISSLFIGTVASKEEYVLKYSWYNPIDPFIGGASAFALMLKNEVETLSAGRIKVELYPSNQLGDAVSVSSQIRQGTVQMLDINTALLSAYLPKISVLDLPYAFSSEGVAARFLDIKSKNPFVRDLIEELAEVAGIRMLSINTFGYRNLSNNVRPIHTVDDVKGLKIRMRESLTDVKMMEAMGAQVTAIPWVELYTSLQTKVVDGCENPFSLFNMMSFHEVQKYMTLTKHTLGVASMVISEKWFQSLPDDLKVVVLKAHEKAYPIVNSYYGLLDDVGLQTIIDNGVEVYVPTPDEFETFKISSAPVQKMMEEEFGKEYVQEFLDAVQVVEESFIEEAEFYKK